MADEIEPTPAPQLDADFCEGWQRLTDEPQVRAVEAYRWADVDDWPWQITVWVAEYLRREPLEGELRRRVYEALRAVPGVADVVREDREVWLVAGEPDGRALVAAAASVVDDLADQARVELRPR